MKLKPAFPDAYLNLGNVYKVCLHLLCRSGSVADISMQYIRNKICFSFVYKALGRPTEAIMCYQHALQMRPNCAMAFGECYLIN